MDLRPLVRSSYSIEEVVTRWQTVHEDYDIDYLQEKIASCEIRAYLNLKNCYLFPVDEVEKSYDYLQVCDVTEGFGSEIIFSFFVKSGIFESLHNKTIYKSEIEGGFPTTSQIIGSLIIPTDLGVIKNIYLYHIINSCDLLNPNFSIERSRESLEGPIPLNLDQPIIKVSDCGLSVTPWYQVEPLSGAYIPKNSIPESLEVLNLSPKKYDFFEDWLRSCRVVELNGNFYYVVNEKNYEFDGGILTGYSLSEDVLNSYQGEQNVVILKEDLEDFENKKFYNKPVLLPNCTEKRAFALSSKDKTLEILVTLVNEFENSTELKRQGVKTEQGFIKSWIESQPYKLKGHHVRILKELISERYGITTNRTESL